MITLSATVFYLLTSLSGGSTAAGSYVPSPYADLRSCRAAGDAAIANYRDVSWGDMRSTPRGAYTCVPHYVPDTDQRPTPAPEEPRP